MKRKSEEDPNKKGIYDPIPQAIGLTPMEKSLLFGILLGFVAALVLMMSICEKW
jgi:hypothetical protein